MLAYTSIYIYSYPYTINNILVYLNLITKLNTLKYVKKKKFYTASIT